MTSHSAEDKAHWFLPDGEVGVGGGGGFDGATQGRVKEAARKINVAAAVCVPACYLFREPFAYMLHS